MYLSREAGWYDVDGNAVYIRAKEQYADDDPAVKALPAIFDRVSGDAAKGAAKAAVAAAKTAAKETSHG